MKVKSIPLFLEFQRSEDILYLRHCAASVDAAQDCVYSDLANAALVLDRANLIWPKFMANSTRLDSGKH